MSDRPDRVHDQAASSSRDSMKFTPSISSSNAPATVPIRLRTSLPGCSIPYVPYMVPVTWRRSQLSTLVNKVLATAQGAGHEEASYKAVPFDFIVDGSLLRCSLDEYLEQRGQSAETTLELEYIRSTLPPAFKDAARQDDWVSSVDARHAHRILTASYDGIVRIFDSESLATSPPQSYTPAYASNVSLTSAKWLRNTADAIVTGSMSGTVAVWRVPGTETKSVPVLQAAELQHHTSPVSSIDVAVAATNASAERATIVSAGWDGSIALWDVPADARFETQEETGGAPGKKRRKQHGSDARPISSAIITPPPLMVLHHVTPSLGATAARALNTAPTPGPNARTIAALGDGDQRIWSAAWDGTVKYWDVVAGGGLAGRKQTDKVPLCLDPLQSLSLSSFTTPQLVCGHMDHSLALYDFRDAVSNAALAMSGAHAAPVSAVKVHPVSAHLFASGAYDGRIKVWDVRSPKQALFALSEPVSTSSKSPHMASSKQPRTKVLGLDWTPDGNALVSGGEDCRVCLYQGQAIGVEHV